MKNSEVLSLHNLLENEFADKEDLGIKFTWAVVRTRKIIKRELIENLQEISKPHEKAGEYNEKRVELCKKYAEKDGDKPKAVEGQFIIKEALQGEFDTKSEELKEEYKEVVEKADQNNKKVEELLKAECDFELHKVDEEHIPEKITPRQLEILEPMIKS